MTNTVTMSMAVPHIDFWYQHNLTIEQASAYFCIGENKMRKIVEKNPTERFILKNGTKTLMKNVSYFFGGIVFIGVINFNIYIKIKASIRVSVTGYHLSFTTSYEVVLEGEFISDFIL